MYLCMKKNTKFEFNDYMNIPIYKNCVIIDIFRNYLFRLIL